MIINIVLFLIALFATINNPLFMGMLWLFFILLLIIPPIKNFICSKIGIGRKPAKIIRIIMISLLVVSSAFVEYKSYNSLLHDLKQKAQLNMWSRLKINLGG